MGRKDGLTVDSGFVILPSLPCVTAAGVGFVSLAFLGTTSSLCFR